MKALLVFGLLGIISNQVFATDYPLIDKIAARASYEVPVSEDLKEYAQFELPDFEKKVDGDKFSVEYTLPAVLTGNAERIELNGKVRANKDEILLTGKKGAAKCVGLLSTITCTISYENLDIDEGKVIEAIRNMSTSDKEFSGRIEVMRSFSTDPVGIITY